jgi:SAM-dependent methyltransferase
MSIVSLPQRIAAKTRRALTRSAAAEAWRQRQRRRILSQAFVASSEYHRLMTKYYDEEIDGLNSAELLTKNFHHRHFKKNAVLGAWRWLGVYEKRDLLQKYVFSHHLAGLDVGGARGPISLEVDLCDRLEKDIFRRDIKYHDISEISNGSLDYVWSSHTLEHIPELEDFICRLRDTLKDNGKLIILVPAYTCRRWRAGSHKYTDEGGDSSHLYTFCLTSDKIKEETAGCCAIDEVVGRHFAVDEAEMVGDNSIFLLATR